MTEPDDTQPLDLRNLVIAGGHPYILITLIEPETGGVEIDHFGLADDVDLAAALQELALLVADS
jgi:hypothetical protein